MGNAYCAQERSRDDLGSSDGTERLSAVWTRYHDDPLQGKARYEPVGEVPGDAVGVVDQFAVDVCEVDCRIYDVRPLEPDPEQLQIHHSQVCQSQIEEINGSAEPSHVASG